MEKAARLNIKRDNLSYIYFVTDGAVWRIPRRNWREDEGESEAEKIAEFGEMDADYLYFLDEDGDISRVSRK